MCVCYRVNVGECNISVCVCILVGVMCILAWMHACMCSSAHSCGCAANGGDTMVAFSVLLLLERKISL